MHNGLIVNYFLQENIGLILSQDLLSDHPSQNYSLEITHKEY
jgi:hypothetical protein